MARTFKTYTLHENGTLELTSFTYPDTDEEVEKIEELLTGRFWMVMKPHFFGARTGIPFKDGKIILEESKWYTEKPEYGPGGFFDKL